MQVLDWITENYSTLFEAAGALYLFLSALVGLTETTTDDDFLARFVQRISFLAPKNARGTFSLPGRSPQDAPGAPKGPGGSIIGFFLFLAVVIGFGGPTQGCVSGVQTGLNTAATVVVELSPEVASFYQDEDLRCRGFHPPLDQTHPTLARAERRDEYDLCMHPTSVIRDTRAMLDRALRVSQAALDAGGQDSFEQSIPCLLEASKQLLLALDAARVSVPSELLDLVAFAEQYPQGVRCHGNR